MNWTPNNIDPNEPEKKFEEGAIVQIQSQDPQENNFGSGFVFFEDEEGVYVLTCAHVVRDVGGVEQVKVKNLPATVIYHSPKGHAEDLAILKVKGLRNLPKLPLGNFRRELSNRKFLTKFRIRAYSEVKSRDVFYEINNIQGHLGDEKPIKGKNQTFLINSWKLNIDQGYLKPGNSGSPVIDSKSYNVLGFVITDEGQGQDKGKFGRAVCIDTLEYVWDDMPPELLRKIYYLEPLSELLRTVFKNEASLCVNLFQVCPEAFFPNPHELTFLPRIQYLIVVCHRKNKLEELLSLIKAKHKRKYKKWISKIDPSYREQKIWCYHKYNLCLFVQGLFIKSRQTTKIQQTIRSRVQLKSLGSYPEDPEITEAKVRALVGFLKKNGVELDRDQVRLLSVKKGCVKIEIELPSEALDKLIELYEQDPSLLENELGILDLTETFREKYNLSNIQTLLEEGFEAEEIISICENNFSDLREIITIDISKSDIVREIILYLRQESLSQESLIRNFLDGARELKPEAYQKHRPYYKVPRRPRNIQRNRQRNSFNYLNSKRIIIASLMIAGLASLGFIGLDVIVIASESLLESIGKPAASPPLVLLYLLLIPPQIGRYVGRLSSNLLRNESSTTRIRIAIICYLMGLIISPVVLALIPQTDSLVLINVGEPLELVRTLHEIISKAIESIGHSIMTMFTPSNAVRFVPTSVGTAGGIYFAYQNAK